MKIFYAGGRAGAVDEKILGIPGANAVPHERRGHVNVNDLDIGLTRRGDSFLDCVVEECRRLP